MAKAEPTGQLVGSVQWNPNDRLPAESSFPKPLAIYAALSHVSEALARQGVDKAQKNQQQGFMFRGIDDVYAALSTLLPLHGVMIIPRVRDRVVTERQSKTGGVLFHVVCTVDYGFYSVTDGSWVQATFIGEAMDSGDKATTKAMAIAYKYMAFQTFCIPVKGQEDPDSESHEVTAVEHAKAVFPELKELSQDQQPITEDQVILLQEWFESVGQKEGRALKTFNVKALSDLTQEQFDRTMLWLKAEGKKAAKP